MYKNIFTYYLFIVFFLGGITACVGNDDYSIPPIPPSGFFKETFDQTGISKAPWPKIGQISGFDNIATVTYSDPYGNVDVRLFNNNPCIWFPKGKNASLVIDNLPTQGHYPLTLKYKFNANLYNTGEISNTNKLKVKCNDVEIQIPNIELTLASNKNKLISVFVKIPKGTTKLEFYAQGLENTKGFRLDDIEIFEGEVDKK